MELDTTAATPRHDGMDYSRSASRQQPKLPIPPGTSPHAGLRPSPPPMDASALAVNLPTPKEGGTAGASTARRPSVAALPEASRPRAATPRSLSDSMCISTPSPRKAPPVVPKLPVTRPVRSETEVIAERHAAKRDRAERFAQSSVSTPNLPKLRRECVFMSDNYRRMVVLRRAEQQKAEKNALQKKSMAQDDAEQLSRLGAEGARMAREERQKRWLTVLGVVAFMSIHETAANLKAMATLKRLLAPVISNIRNRIRLKRRTELVLAIANRDMRHLRFEEVRKSCGFVGWWSKRSIEALIDALTPGVALDQVLIVPPGGVKDVPFCVLSSGTVEYVVNPADAIALGLVTDEPKEEVIFGGPSPQRKQAARRRQALPPGKQFGVLGPDCIAVGTETTPHATFTDIAFASDTRPIVGMRASGRVLYWHCPSHVFARLWEDEVFARGERAAEARCAARRAFVPRLFPPTLSAMSDAGRNELLQGWDERDMADVKELLRPESFEAGHVFSNPGDEATDFFFVAHGLVEISARVAASPENAHASGPKSMLQLRPRGGGGGGGGGEDPMALSRSGQSPRADGYDEGRLSTSMSFGGSMQRSFIGLDASANFRPRMLSNPMPPATAGVAGEDADVLQVVATRGPWSVIGLEGAITGDKRSSCIRAVTQVDAWVGRGSEVVQRLLCNASLFIKIIRGIAGVRAQRMRVEELVRALRQEPCFAGLPRAALLAVARTAKPRWQSAGDPIRLEHGPAQFGLLFLTKGKVHTVGARSNTSATVGIAGYDDDPDPTGDIKPASAIAAAAGSPHRRLRQAPSAAFVAMYSAQGTKSLRGLQVGAPASINVPQALDPATGGCDAVTVGELYASTPVELWELSVPDATTALEEAYEQHRTRQAVLLAANGGKAPAGVSAITNAAKPSGTFEPMSPASFAKKKSATLLTSPSRRNLTAGGDQPFAAVVKQRAVDINAKGGRDDVHSLIVETESWETRRQAAMAMFAEAAAREEEAATAKRMAAVAAARRRSVAMSPAEDRC